MIGDRNAALALQTLDEWKIAVVAADLGGRLGRKVIMNTLTGVVLVGTDKSKA
jgi:chemotaxis protein CheD